MANSSCPQMTISDCAVEAPAICVTEIAVGTIFESIRLAFCLRSPSISLVADALVGLRGHSMRVRGRVCRSRAVVTTRQLFFDYSQQFLLRSFDGAARFVWGSGALHRLPRPATSDFTTDKRGMAGAAKDIADTRPSAGRGPDTRNDVNADANSLVGPVRRESVPLR